eukprot:Opistho-1_new@71861
MQIKLFLLPAFFLLLQNIGLSQSSSRTNTKQAISYRCLPCGQDCDKKDYPTLGQCASCGMELVNKASIRFGNISTASICHYIKTHPSIVLIDVRTKEEFEGKADPDFGGLTNSINIPIQELEKRIPTLLALKEKEIIVFCSHSHRSPRAAYLLGKNGFTKVKNMSGGMSVMKDKTCKK